MAVDKGGRRIYIDCSHGEDYSDLVPVGSINVYIPKPSSENVDECSPVHYQHAHKTFLIHLYHIRCMYPKRLILVHAHDIDAAFCQVLYHLNMAIIFGYVFKIFHHTSRTGVWLPICTIILLLTCGCSLGSDRYDTPRKANALSPFGD